MTCKICGEHEDIDKCKKCVNCEYSHMMKYGKNWETESVKKCPHHCRFLMPDKKWLEYYCKKQLNHAGACDFGVDPKQVEKMARQRMIR